VRAGAVPGEFGHGAAIRIQGGYRPRSRGSRRGRERRQAAERSARLLSAAETLLDTIGLSLAAWPEMRADYDRYVAAARAQLDEATFAAAWAQGRAMTLDQAVAYALE